MQYVLLIYEDDKKWETATEEERRKVYAQHEEFANMLQSRGAMAGGNELAPTSSATTVRTNTGDPMITDGPFAETSEQLGGFYIVEAADLDTAIGYAKALPADTVEVRPAVPE